jgi:cellulose synthase/poly-beta-1,6-N-acetylglucosamine synthase-like glycosyltransferase
MTLSAKNAARVSAIVPARNEQEVIRACVESLAQQEEILEILVVNDQSTDRTKEIVAGLAARLPKVRLLEIMNLPTGWVGKNNAVWMGARESKSDWLLFTDADAVHGQDSAAQALEIAERTGSRLVSFSPEQQLETWYEKSLIPYVYCRLSARFNYAEVNDPQKSTAAANGQFLLIRRDAYAEVGGHSSVAGEVLEDVALARRVKSAGYRIWFGSGRGVVWVRMYRSFRGMWQGWRKNLYVLMGGAEAATMEFLRAALPLTVTVLAGVLAWEFLESGFLALLLSLVGVAAMAIADSVEMRRNQFPPRLIFYGVPGRLLFAGVLWASFRSHRKGKLEWKGREYPTEARRASNG